MPLCGERRIRTYKSLRTPVFKTGAIAVLPALQKYAIVEFRVLCETKSRAFYGTVLPTHPFSFFTEQIYEITTISQNKANINFP